MSKFKPKPHARFKAFLSTAEAATLKPRETDAERAFIFSGQGNGKPCKITNLDKSCCKTPCFRRRNTWIGVNKGTRCLEI